MIGRELWKAQVVAREHSAERGRRGELFVVQKKKTSRKEVENTNISRGKEKNSCSQQCPVEKRRYWWITLDTRGGRVRVYQLVGLWVVWAELNFVCSPIVM